MYHHVDWRYAEVARDEIWSEAASIEARLSGGPVAQIWPVNPVFMRIERWLRALVWTL